MRQPWSLRARLLMVSLTVLLGFVVLTGAVLDRAFRASADAVQTQRLEGLLYLLVGVIDVGPNGELLVPSQLPESQLSVPGSGLYAGITQTALHEQWLSNSTIGFNIPFDEQLGAGVHQTEVRRAGDGKLYRVVSQGVRWSTGNKSVLLVFSVAAPLAAQVAEINVYRRSLWSALGVMSVLLLIALVLVQRWGLRPLGKLSQKLAAMESGAARQVDGVYPAELSPLVNNLNHLLAREFTQIERYRAALGDLAHSLKTPLAVLRGAAHDGHLPTVLEEQVGRMDQIVQYQLQRASTSGASQTAPPLVLATLLRRLLTTMDKVYADKKLQLECLVDDEFSARLDEGDALELLGNLIDNACKWAHHQVQVQAERSEGGIYLTVDDDGPGIPEPDRVLGRGQRGDERMPGHGIGLAIVQDIALAYRGEVRIEISPLGGARFVVWLGQA